jgi:hypothetical protein
VVHALSTKFPVVANIARSHLDEKGGWIILEMEGSDDAISQAVAWLAEQGVGVERIEG